MPHDRKHHIVFIPPKPPEPEPGIGCGIAVIGAVLFVVTVTLLLILGRVERAGAAEPYPIPPIDQPVILPYPIEVTTIISHDTPVLKPGYTIGTAVSFVLPDAHEPVIKRLIWRLFGVSGIERTPTP